MTVSRLLAKISSAVHRRRPAGILLFLLLLAGCTPPFSMPWSSPTATAIPTPSATPTPTPRPTSSPTPAPTASPRPTPAPSDLYLPAAGVALYPGPPIYAGDWVTFDVTPDNLGELKPEEIQVRVYLQTHDQTEVVAEGNLGYFGFDGVPRARIVWSWDTTDLAGPQNLTVWLDPDDDIQEGDEDPDNNIIVFAVDILPQVEQGLFESTATWMTATTDCCIMHYITGSSAERDLPELVVMTERAVAYAETKLGARLSEPFEIYWINRVIAHGAYARNELILSYLDRRYTAASLEVAVRHEATHVLDRELLEEGWPPSILREGLAVWVAGGHFKLEALPPRAAALLQLDMYIPLEPLADDFYRKQHEIGYLEAAALVTYLVETYGWDAFIYFYTHFDSSGTGSDMLDAELKENFDLGLAELEEAYLHWLREQSPTPEHGRDLQDTVYFFDTLRRYEALYDPQAYFMSGWLPDPVWGEARGIEADFLRHPRTVENIALETMLIAAQEAQLAEDLAQAEYLLDVVNRVLDTGHFDDAPEADYLALVEVVAAAGYEVQRIELHAATARVWAIATWPELVEFDLQRTSDGWILLVEELGN